MKLAPGTKNTVEYILNMIKQKLKELQYTEES